MLIWVAMLSVGVGLIDGKILYGKEVKGKSRVVITAEDFSFNRLMVASVPVSGGKKDDISDDFWKKDLHLDGDVECGV